ncbi:hypothetical protein [Streptomyces sp. NPDC048644]|uniref:hypothetical protein n=1 Tax=Streptomyces sp. NPDC048644 TaxID=3365582 RepID=UPI00371EE2B8
MLKKLVRKANLAGPALAGLGTNFGLSTLVGKPLAVISDARLSGNDNSQVVERLLTISGEDTIDIDGPWAAMGHPETPQDRSSQAWAATGRDPQQCDSNFPLPSPSPPGGLGAQRRTHNS